VQTRGILALAALFASTPLPAAARTVVQTLTPEALLAIEYPVHVAAAPDGHAVAIGWQKADVAENGWKNWLELVSSDGGEVELGAGSAPEWMADSSSLYMLRTTSGTSQVWAYLPGLGVFRQVTDLPLPVVGFRAPVAGGKLLVALEVDPACDTLECSKTGLTAVRGFDDVPIYHYSRFLSGRQVQPFLVESAEKPARTARRLIAMLPDHGLCGSSFSGGSADQMAMNPDGQGAHVCLQSPDPLSKGGFLYQIHALDWSSRLGNATNRVIDTGTNPVVLGRTGQIAYLKPHDPAHESAWFDVVIRNLKTGHIRRIDLGDRTPEALAASPDGRFVYAGFFDRMDFPLLRIAVKTGQQRRLPGEGVVGAFSADAVQGVWYGRSTLDMPPAVYRQGPDGSPPVLVTSRFKPAEDNLGKTRAFEFAGADGDTVRGKIMLPPSHKRASKHPVLLFIHGGPKRSVDNRWHPRLNLQLYAAQGFVVVAIDPHGSVGYGKRFMESVDSDWGGRPLLDLQSGLKAAAQIEPSIDLSRACAFGQSYGGFMINWIASQWPDGFRCLINHAGISDTRTFALQMDELPYVERAFGGPYLDNPEAYARFNPILRAKEWNTPMLLLHGMKDYRVPWGQSLNAFTALRSNDVPARLILFENEGHAILTPQNTLRWMQEKLAWLARWGIPETAQKVRNDK